jgi:6,7-dimethyl-8-ribityllumazine synthase
MNLFEGKVNPDQKKFAIILSKFNEFVCEGLLNGAREALLSNGVKEVNIDLINVPGAFEIPVTADRLALTKKYDAIICLGAVIKGETAHFEYISETCSFGIQKVALKHSLPIAFGVLTAYTVEQAIARAGSLDNNKGYEAALAALEMSYLFKLI